MKYESRVTCFLDILGFQKHINDTINSDGDDDEEEIQKISQALLLIRKVLNIDESKAEKSRVVTQFSDCIVISFLGKEESGVFWVLMEIQMLIIELVAKGIICRGGISYGKLVHTEKLVFGPALVEAYKMESEAALYPRVILNKSVIDIGGENKADFHSAETEIEHIKGVISKDADGMYYVDFFGKALLEFDDPDYGFLNHLSRLSKIIEIGLKNKSPSIFVKYQWLKEKYNKVVIPYQDSKLKWKNPEIESEYKALPIF